MKTVKVKIRNDRRKEDYVLILKEDIHDYCKTAERLGDFIQKLLYPCKRYRVDAIRGTDYEAAVQMILNHPDDRPLGYTAGHGPDEDSYHLTYYHYCCIGRRL